jgi:hypothetical protein
MLSTLIVNILWTVGTSRGAANSEASANTHVRRKTPALALTFVDPLAPFNWHTGDDPRFADA